MWELDHKETWAPKNWCFWTVVLEKTLESPLDCKEIQQVNPKENQFWMNIHWEDWCWSWNFGHLMQRADSLEKTLILGKIKGRRRSGQQMMRLLDSISDMWLSLSNMSLSNMSLSNMSWWWTGKVGVLQSMGVAKSWTWLSDWTDFHAPLSPSSRGSLVPLHFLPSEWCHLHIWGWQYFSWKSWFQLVIHLSWHFSWCNLHYVRRLKTATGEEKYFWRENWMVLVQVHTLHLDGEQYALCK